MTATLQELDEVLRRYREAHRLFAQDRWADFSHFLWENRAEIRAALELQGKLGVIADDWNRRDKESRERGGSRIYVTDCANELRHALKAAPPAGGQDDR